MRELLLLLISLLTFTSSRAACPTKCTCISSKADCSDVGLTAIPKDLPRYIRHVDLSNNQITEIGDSAFPTPQNLETLDLSFNTIQHVSSQAFKDLNFELKLLNLSHNRLNDNSFPNGAVFSQTRGIEVLDLSFNDFSRIPDDKLTLLSNLRQLHIHDCGLTDPVVGPGLKDMDELEFLDMSGSNLGAIQFHTFQTITNNNDVRFKALNLSRCGITSIDQNAFASFNHLVHIELGDNPNIPFTDLNHTITSMKDYSALNRLGLANTGVADLSFVFNSFFGVAGLQLEELDLSRNQISHFGVQDLSSLSQLKRLNLSRNHIANVPLLRLDNLQVLDLSTNQIAGIGQNSFESVNNLISVDLSRNRLTELDSQVFSKNTRLESIDMAYNSIRTVPSVQYLEGLKYLNLQGNTIEDPTTLFEANRLENLNLAFNEISELRAYLTPADSSIERLNLTGNQISSIDSQAFELKSPAILDLSGNRLTMLESWSLTLIEQLFLSNNDLEDISATAFDNWQWLERLDLSKNKLVSLPRNMFTDQLKDLRKLDLSDNELGEFLIGYDAQRLFKRRDTGPELKLEELVLRNNGIEQLLGNFFSNLSTLIRLDLSYNSLNSVSAEPFSGLSLLEELNLAHNNLSSFDPKEISSLVNLQKIRLSGLAWSCDCSLKDVKQWLDSSYIEVIGYNSNGEYLCAEPEELLGTPLHSFTISEDTCKTDSMEKTIILIIIGCTSFVILVVAAIIFWQHRWRLKKRIKKQHYSAINGAVPPPPGPNGSLISNSEYHTTTPQPKRPVHCMDSMHHHHPRHHHHPPPPAGGAFV